MSVSVAGGCGPGVLCSGSQPLGAFGPTLSTHGSTLLHPLRDERRTRAFERVERCHRAHPPAGRAQGFEGVAPTAGRELRDRRRGHQDPAGRQAALNPLADFFPFIESPPSSPEPPKLGAFFMLPAISGFLSGFFHAPAPPRRGNSRGSHRMRRESSRTRSRAGGRRTGKTAA